MNSHMKKFCPTEKMGHVLCVYPYRRELNDVGFFPPLGLEFIAETIRPFARDTEVVDMRKEKGKTADFIRQDTEMICFSLNWDRDQDFIESELKAAPAGIFTIAGGRHATENPQKWLEKFSNIDIVVRGDGEEAIEEICRGIPLEEITGISFRRNDEIIHNKNRMPGELKDNVFPQRRLRKYTYDVILGGAGTGLEVDMIASSRGCPFNCSFCSFSRNPWGTKRKWAARSPESVVAEIEQTSATLIGFTDDLFTFDMDRVEKICDLLLEKKIRKKYFINARLEIAKRPDVLKKMEKVGFVFLMLGVESPNDKTLKSMNKGFNTAQIEEYFKILSKTKMLLHGYFILGSIGESMDDMAKILPFAQKIKLDTIALSTLRAGPYSGLEELVAQNTGYHIGPKGKIYSDFCSVEELSDMRRQLYRKFYNLPKILHIAKKSVCIGALNFIPGLLPRLPSILFNVIGHRKKRKKKINAIGNKLPQYEFPIKNKKGT